MNNYFMETHHHEWILTNRLGGYALGTGNLINQRKYHGLLIASDRAFQRRHLVAGMEEKVEWRGESFHLDSNNYSNCIYPEGFLYLVKPWLRPYPIFLYSSLPHQNDILIRKEIFMDEYSNTIVLKYTNLGHHKLHFEFHPKYSMINHHELNSPGSLEDESFKTDIAIAVEGTAFNALRQSNQFKVYGYIPNGAVKENRYTYYNVFYPWEEMKGYQGIGDQISLFELSFDLGVGDENYVIFSDQLIDYSAQLIKNIVKRYDELPKPHDYPSLSDMDANLLFSIDFNDSQLFNYQEYLKILEFAVKDFVSNDDIVAGYPWYGVWGRDTMYVLNAMLHNPDWRDLVEKTLLKYSCCIKDGLIPNVFPETGREANYESIDATLWYVILLYKFGKIRNTVKNWLFTVKITEQILEGIITNKNYPFQIREDGLIELYPEFAHATWMDVRIDGKAVTPRDGAPVELNALWYNAICCYQDMCLIHNQKSSRKHKVDTDILDYKDKVLSAFQQYWLDDYPADRLIGDKPVREFRPNSLIAASLPWPLFSQEQMQMLFEKSYRELYTFYGIRTLSPKDVRFRKKYYGSQIERDKAYHNGSVWAWLLGAFCGTYLKAYKGIKTEIEIKKDLSEFIGNFRNSFMRGHIGSVAEIWDGDAPHFPKGAPAMAWSVAALYNIETYIAALEEDTK
ncbi:MAG: amylo-alpha-1,6-glucosidase [Candidatus Cloacimonadaceae bacterium]